MSESKINTKFDDKVAIVAPAPQTSAPPVVAPATKAGSVASIMSLLQQKALASSAPSVLPSAAPATATPTASSGQQPAPSAQPSVMVERPRWGASTNFQNPDVQFQQQRSAGFSTFEEGVAHSGGHSGGRSSSHYGEYVSSTVPGLARGPDHGPPKFDGQYQAFHGLPVNHQQPFFGSEVPFVPGSDSLSRRHAPHDQNAEVFGSRPGRPDLGRQVGDEPNRFFGSSGSGSVGGIPLSDSRNDRGEVF